LPRLDERILRLRPDVLFLMFGTNDAVAGHDGLETFARQYAQVIEVARNAGIGAIVVQTTVPMMPVDPEAAIVIAEWPNAETREGKLQGLRRRRACLAQYVAATREVARRCGVALVDHWAAWCAAGGRRGQLMDGGFHPNEYGHRLLAHTLLRQCGMWDERSWTCRLFVPVDEPWRDGDRAQA
jgi:lysophospholipase L1-like esterase